MKTCIERLSSDQLTCYFKRAKVFLEPEFFKERVNKLSAHASFITTRNDDQELIAVVGFYMNRQPQCFITHVSVIDAYKRQGIASYMLSYLENEAKSKGFTSVKLEVNKNNTPAINAYIKCGYTKEGECSDRSYFMCKCI